MAKKDPHGFLKIPRASATYRPICERVTDFAEVTCLKQDIDSQAQAKRCMDCGTPFCHWACPLANLIPEWNEYMHAGFWHKAIELLNTTNPLPEITGRVCPALCEYACVLGIGDDPVTIRENELGISEHAFVGGLLTPKPPSLRTGKKVAVIGSGPAGLSCAAQLNHVGHEVVVFERDNAVGGILRYGIPDFKLDKSIIDRRVKIWEQEGIVFQTNVHVGKESSFLDLKKQFDAVCLAIGSRVPRDMNIPGRDLSGIHFAMDYLIQANRRVRNEHIPAEQLIDARGKRVVVIGGGDTGSDCIGTAHRQGAFCVVQIEVMPKPGECRGSQHPWPKYPLLLKTTSSHQEGGTRHWCILTKRFVGQEGKVKKLSCVQVDYSSCDARGCPVMREMPDSTFEIEADLVILAIGFMHPEHTGIIEDSGLVLDERKNIKTDSSYMTSHQGIFAAGDARRGQSLVVWAIQEGLSAARAIDEYLVRK